MTNETIIQARAFALMDAGIIQGSGRFGTITGEDGEPQRVELPEDIHTFQGWKLCGRSVKKGEKAVDTFKIWKFTAKILDTDTGNAELDKFNAAINAEGGQTATFMQSAAFFTFGQTEPTADREARTAEKQAAKAARKAAKAAPVSSPAPQVDAATEAAPVSVEDPAPEKIAPAAPEITPHYYPINEDTARRAKEMRSYSDYKPGTATAEYKGYIDEATKTLENVLPKCKTEAQREHARRLYDAYCREMADYINRDNEIGTRCPSILIAGGGNFTARKKQKQVAAWERNQETWKQADAILYKLRGVHLQGIQSNDPEALEVLRAKLEKLEAAHETMKQRNAEARKAKQEAPFPGWALQNSNANIKRVRERVESLEAMQTAETVTEAGPGYTYEENAEAVRIRFIFDGKPDDKTREALKANGFRWAPSVGAWQRQLNDNGRRAAGRVKLALAAPALD